jgi:hypothetical protein
VLEELRQETIRKMEEVRNDPTLTDKEKDKKIIELATELGKAYLEGLAKCREQGKAQTIFLSENHVEDN